MNTSLKIITKGMNNRLAPVVKKIIEKYQTAFMQNRYIMEGVSMLHENFHEVQQKKCVVSFSNLILKRHMTM
jgi:hypothetical protein